MSAPLPRIDLSVRIAGSGCRIQLRKPSGSGLYTSVYVAPGLYADGKALATAISSTIGAFSPLLTCVNSGASFTIASSSGTFDLQIDDRTITTYTGLSYATYSGITSATAVSPSIFVSSFPWQSSPSWVLTRKASPVVRGHLVVKSLALWREWSVDALVTAAETSRLQAVLRVALRGVPFTHWRDQTNLTAWTWANATGGSLMVMPAGMNSYALDWTHASAQTHARVALNFREATP